MSKDTSKDASADPLADASTPPAAPPVKVTRSGKTWPFHAWNRAEAVTFNLFPMRPGVPTLAYDDVRGWSPYLVDRKALDAAQGSKALSFVMQTKGSVDVSKCPFPRHAVVLYEGELPVATINVCFACGDIVVWPEWREQPDLGASTKPKQEEQLIRYRQYMKIYDAVFLKWQNFFRDEVGFPVDNKYAR